MRRPQFTIRALLVAMLVVAAFFGGMTVQRRLDDAWAPVSRLSWGLSGSLPEHEEISFPDGTKWKRIE